MKSTYTLSTLTNSITQLTTVTVVALVASSCKPDDITYGEASSTMPVTEERTAQQVATLATQHTKQGVTAELLILTDTYIQVQVEAPHRMVVRDFVARLKETLPQHYDWESSPKAKMDSTGRTVQKLIGEKQSN